MRVLVVNHRFFVSGGPERYMFSVIDLLERRGHDVVPFAIRFSQNRDSAWEPFFASPIAGDDEVYFKQRRMNLHTAVRSLERTVYSREVYRNVRDIVAVAKPDAAIVLHFLRSLSPSVLCALSDHGIPTAVRLSDFALVCSESHLQRDGRLCDDCVGKSMARGVVRRCLGGSLARSAVNAAAMEWARMRGYFSAVDAFIAPSPTMAEYMVRGGLDRRRVHLLPTPVFTSPDVQREERVRRIAYVGRLVPIKGLETLLRAFALVKADARYADVELSIAGDASAPESQEMMRLADSLGGAGPEFLGQLMETQVRQLLTSSLFSVVPSLCMDNLPNSLLESLACGTPVVVSDVRTLRDAVAGSSAAALTFAAGNVGELADCMCRLLDDPGLARRMGSEALALAHARYSPEEHVAGLERLLGDLVSDHATVGPSRSRVGRH